MRSVPRTFPSRQRIIDRRHSKRTDAGLAYRDAEYEAIAQAAIAAGVPLRRSSRAGVQQTLAMEAART